MTGISFAFALSAGVLAAFNPCAFAMLPSFLAYFLGTNDEHFKRLSWLQRVGIGVRAGFGLVAGFVLMFLLAGLVFALLGSQLVKVVPWLALLIGLALIGFGLLTLLNRAPHITITNPVDTIEGRGMRALFLYGISYGIASLSCTLPIFLMVMSSVLTAGNLLSGIVPFLGYSSGMALVVIGLTLATALLKGALVQQTRRVLPYVNRLSGLLLIAAGAYIVYFQFSFSILPLYNHLG